MNDQRIALAAKWLPLAGLGVCVLLCVLGWQRGIFSSQDALHQFITSFGAAGALVFVLLQAVQVVLPILPGGLSCLAGVVLFGAWQSFLYNYIGICIGSVLAFLVARLYGDPLLVALFGSEKLARYHSWTEKNNRFSKLFAFAIFFPVAPDDFLCYLAGTTRMSLRHFTAIILLGKPFSIALYSLGLATIFNHFTAILSV